MAQHRFYLGLGLLTAVTIMSVTKAAGAMIGFFFGFGIAMFVAGPSFMLAAALQHAGIPVTDRQVGLALALVYLAITIIAIAAAWRAWRRGWSDAARLAVMRLAVLVALPLIGWLSLHSLARAWPG